MTTTEFTYKLQKTTNYKGVEISLYSSTLGWFIETSEGLVSQYINTKKEALSYLKGVKEQIKIG